MAGRRQQQQCGEKSSGFCYTDMSSTSNPTIQFQTHDQVNHIHGFVSDPTEMFNLTTSMEMIRFSKNLHQQHQDFTPAETTSHENLIVHHDSAAWQQQNRTLLVDDSSSLRCLFPTQGLSLSLSSTSTTNPFELRHQQQQMLQDGYLMNTTTTTTKDATNIYYHRGQGEGQPQFLLKNSKFLVPLQDLLNEFCSLGTNQNDLLLKQMSPKINKQSKEDNGNGSSTNHSLTSLEFIELQKRKTKLLSMLEEVDRKYKHYCNQMKAVVSTFEAIAGNGAAIVYSTLALKAMSRHFRCLKDGILDQIEVTRKTIGEKDPVTPGASKGETPRLRILDRVIRQQRAFQQINMMETQTHPWRPQRGLPERSVSVLRAWLFEHFLHPYPSDVDKHILARQTGLSKSQVSNWFINARVRLWKPMVEEMYLEEEKEQQRNATSSDGGVNNEDDIAICTTNN